MKVNVRYFKYDFDKKNKLDIIECSEIEFLEAEGSIQYERNTIFQNGCSQICLTKTNNFV